MLNKGKLGGFTLSSITVGTNPDHTQPHKHGGTLYCVFACVYGHTFLCQADQINTSASPALTCWTPQQQICIQYLRLWWVEQAAAKLLNKSESQTPSILLKKQFSEQKAVFLCTPRWCSQLHLAYKLKKLAQLLWCFPWGFYLRLHVQTFKLSSVSWISTKREQWSPATN